VTITYTRLSIFTGASHTVALPLSTPEFEAAYTQWKAGMLIQEAFPTLDSSQREFLMTGATPEEWDNFVWRADEDSDEDPDEDPDDQP